jgi:hypothetical protein
LRPFGAVPGDRLLASGSTIRVDGIGDCWLELEIGLRLARPLRGPDVTAADACVPSSSYSPMLDRQVNLVLCAVQSEAERAVCVSCRLVLQQ